MSLEFRMYTWLAHYAGRMTPDTVWQTYMLHRQTVLLKSYVCIYSGGPGNEC